MYSVTVGDTIGVANNHSLSFDGVDDYVIGNTPILFGVSSVTMMIDAYVRDYGTSQIGGYSYIGGTPNSNIASDKGFNIKLSPNNSSFSAHIGDGNSIIVLVHRLMV